MDLVDEEDVALLEVGEQADEVARPLEHRARAGAEVDAHFLREQDRERRLAEAGRAEKQRVVERLLAGARGLDRDLEVLAHLGLADELGEARRPERRLGAGVVAERLGRGDFAARAHVSVPPGR